MSAPRRAAIFRRLVSRLLTFGSVKPKRSKPTSGLEPETSCLPWRCPPWAFYLQIVTLRAAACVFYRRVTADSAVLAQVLQQSSPPRPGLVRAALRRLTTLTDANKLGGIGRSVSTSGHGTQGPCTATKSPPRRISVKNHRSQRVEASRARAVGNATGPRALPRKNTGKQCAVSATKNWPATGSTKPTAARLAANRSRSRRTEGRSSYAAARPAASSKPSPHSSVVVREVGSPDG